MAAETTPLFVASLRRKAGRPAHRGVSPARERQGPRAHAGPGGGAPPAAGRHERPLVGRGGQDQE
eukprot:6513103-Pyramimonas_sp.AAC.1